MTVSETHKIDIVASDPDGKIVCAMCEPRQWGSSTRMIDELIEKIQVYIAFIGSEGYKNQHGDTEASIALIASYEPPEDVKSLLKEIGESEGIEISYKVMPT